MAETLGSLVDKLTIKDIREFFINKMIDEKRGEFNPAELNQKLAILNKQKESLKKEIDAFVLNCVKTRVVVKDEKLKLYNARKDIGAIPETASLGGAISGLASKNLELWNLEDQARRKDVELKYIGQVKRKIDLCNQQRNDYIDKIDTLFEQKIKALKKSAKK
jgi:Protein of unknown function (DUF4254)